jgi:hypothetical protein
LEVYNTSEHLTAATKVIEFAMQDSRQVQDVDLCWLQR